METQDQSEIQTADGEATERTPGLVLIFVAGRPRTFPIALVDGHVELGRDHPAFVANPDPRISRRHARIQFDGRRYTVTDLGSRNGTAADGETLAAAVPQLATRVIRVGDSLLLPLADITAIQRHGVHLQDGHVVGPATRDALEAAAQAGRLGATLHVTGESGAGKESLARAFHAARSPAGPFVPVNCATIPEGMAERLLFGTRKGAYSGADADADGYLQAANGGVLFLDEIAELALTVQAKLLRVLETGDVIPLGASRPRKVDLRLCTATHRDLRAQVAAGKLREDLFFRIATPRVAMPPLRERPEEVPWLLQQAVARVDPSLTLHFSVVERALLRPWPGNVRELLAEARSATQTALRGDARRVEARHLGEGAGSAFAAPLPPPAEPATDAPTRAQIVAALKRHAGNISAAARELGAHRTQLRRWMARHEIAAHTDADE